MHELTKINNDTIDWRIQRKHSQDSKIIVFTFHGDLGNAAQTLSDLFSCRILGGEDENVLFFSEKFNSITMNMAVKDFVDRIK